MTRLAMALAIAVAVSTSGCAAMMKDAPKSDWRPSQAPRCSESNGGIALDAIFATLYGVVSIALLSEDQAGAALPFAGFAGLHIWSAVAGHGATTKCTEAIEQHDQWLVQREESLERKRKRDLEGDDLAEAPPEADPEATEPDPGDADPGPSDDDRPNSTVLADPYAPSESTFVDDDGHWKDFWREVKR